MIKITASIRLYVWITVWWSCWFSDPQAVKSLSALVVPVGSLEDPEAYQGLAHYLEHMSLMGSKKYPQADSLAEYLKMHGGSHNASTAPYRTAFYLEV
ncbi:protease III [Escherichia coli]|uniref:Protease III n=1 Tax=Escherichia coli TaxID=562 RepID=A0A376TUB3_ECOLX|nr:protease III [Escherichia coli]